MSARVRVYVATSLDGFIAGPDDDLSWLTGPDAVNPGGGTDAGALTYDELMEAVGAVLLGRRTFDVVQGLGSWGYGDRPVLVATHRELGDAAPETARAVSGPIERLVAVAREAAAGRDVYLDGGDLIRQAATAGLIDELTLTIAPVALGRGRPLFAGLSDRYPVEILSHHTFDGGMVQIRARPVPAGPRPGPE